MVALKWLLMAAGVALFGSTAAVVAYDVYLAMQFQKLMSSGSAGADKKAGLLAGQAGTSRPSVQTPAAKFCASCEAPRLAALRFKEAAEKVVWRTAFVAQPFLAVQFLQQLARAHSQEWLCYLSFSAAC